MIKSLRLFAVLLAIAVAGVWYGLGADRGWSKTALAIPLKDPITEIEYVEYKSGFIPGVDFLAAGLAGAAVLFALTFSPLKKPKSKTS